MLYDPKWEQINSLSRLIAWLEQQPAATSYDFCWPTRCLLAQYLKANGISDFNLGSGEARAFFGDGGEIIYGDGNRSTWTFGAALARARSMNCADGTET